MSYKTYIIGGELYHYGVKGMKWGIRRYQPYGQGYSKSTGKFIGSKSNLTSQSGIRSYIAKKQNEKVNKSFKRWKESDINRDDAIKKGIDYNSKKMTYLANKSDDNKKAMKDSKKIYKQALRQNTTYRKGVVKEAVGQDAYRKYQSEAKKIKKKLDKDPENKELQKRYKKMNDSYNIERARARRVADVYANRSRKIASTKAAITMTIKGAAMTAAIAGGVYATNYLLRKKGVNFNLNNEQVRRYVNIGRKVIRYI